jgi:hypothetical protein
MGQNTGNGYSPTASIASVNHGFPAMAGFAHECHGLPLFRPGRSELGSQVECRP